MQAPPGPHELPQKPQLFGSVCVSMHCEPQQLLGALHGPHPIATQPPPTHVAPGPHARPQRPQLFGSLAVFTHIVPQHVSNPGHRPPQAGGRHTLATQGSPAGHVDPQLPQFSGSVVVSRQRPPQHCMPPGQSRATRQTNASGASRASAASPASPASAGWAASSEPSLGITASAPASWATTRSAVRPHPTSSEERTTRRSSPRRVRMRPVSTVCREHTERVQSDRTPFASVGDEDSARRSTSWSGHAGSTPRRTTGAGSEVVAESGVQAQIPAGRVDARGPRSGPSATGIARASVGP